MIGLYAKAIAGALALALTAWITGLQDELMTAQEWVAVSAAFVVGGGAVWLIPNQQSGLAKYGKAITAFIAAGLASLWTALNDVVVSQTEVLTIILAMLAVGGVVAIVPNARRSEAAPVAPPA